jgi:hypothetical protein
MQGLDNVRLGERKRGRTWVGCTRSPQIPFTLFVPSSSSNAGRLAVVVLGLPSRTPLPTKVEMISETLHWKRPEALRE